MSQELLLGGQLHSIGRLQRENSHITLNTCDKALKTIEDVSHQVDSETMNQARNSFSRLDSGLNAAAPSMKRVQPKTCKCLPMALKLKQQEGLAGDSGSNQQTAYKTCGDMCRNTPSRRQCEIITSLLKKEVNQGNYIGLRSSKKNLAASYRSDASRSSGNGGQPQGKDIRLMNIINARWWH